VISNMLRFKWQCRHTHVAGKALPHNNSLWLCCFPDLTVAKLDQLATLGLPLYITEFDIGTNNTAFMGSEQDQAEDMER
jgi:hypothetical protein